MTDPKIQNFSPTRDGMQGDIPDCFNAAEQSALLERVNYLDQLRKEASADWRTTVQKSGSPQR